MIELVKPYKTIAIIGMDKNVGKTTTLNALITRFSTDTRLGLTSIGRDGESVDRVRHHSKPKIYVKAGTIIASAKQCLVESDITKQILETTGMNTPLGEIILVRALSDGYVQIAGPSFNQQLKQVVDKLKSYGVDHVLIDGALGRKGLADASIADAIILATGAAYTHKLEKLIRDTVHVNQLFGLKQVEQVDYFRKLIQAAPISIVDQQGNVQLLTVKTALMTAELLEQVPKATKYLIVRGAITNPLLKGLIDKRKIYPSLTLVIENGTKCLCDERTYAQFLKSGFVLKVVEPLNLIAITVNPTSPDGLMIDEELLKSGLAIINKPIWNVVGGS
jgi:molybdopterin-guanine dinucleotide biosynthesis protein